MWNWLTGLWHTFTRWMNHEKPPAQIYHRSNLHGRHR